MSSVFIAFLILVGIIALIMVFGILGYLDPNSDQIRKS